MADQPQISAPRMGTLPVFMTAISTILGAILFLRFGYAIGHVGLVNTLGIILIGHLVTIPTAMAVAEIATNQKVEGGGAYFMISRSFGLNIGAAIGIALFLSQAISVAFYIIAFAESYHEMYDMWFKDLGMPMASGRTVGLIAMGVLSLLMLTKGANIGVKALYIVVMVLFVSLGLFFAGDNYSEPGSTFTSAIRNGDSFFYVFTIIFPAFTGIAAGLGLSGDLKDPKKSIPRGTIWATVVGILIYVLVSFKLFYSASPADLAGDQMIMSKIALWPPIIPIGLACAAISSALGSIMIAPRTLQALGVDEIFPGNVNGWFAKGLRKSNEPFNSTIITCIIAFFFIAIGDINFVAQIISMFFMLTYGAICLISFLEHFAADPSYRPTFKSKWYFSLFGALLCFWLMFKMNFNYALLSLVIMGAIYWWVSSAAKTTKGVANLFRGVIFQMSRELQVFLQKRDSKAGEEKWRPFIICMSQDSFKRRSAFDMIRWLSFKYGFGTYIHFIEGFLNQETYQEASDVKTRLLKLAKGVKSRVYLDTIISPSYTSAIAQSIQLSGVSGKGNNMILFEFSESEPETLEPAVQNHHLLKAAEFDVAILRSSYKAFGYKKSLHLWINPADSENATLMILLGYIILGHPEWKRGTISIYSIYNEGEYEAVRDRLYAWVDEGRLPISKNNVQLISLLDGADREALINQYSRDADLTLMSYRDSDLLQGGVKTFTGFRELGNVLYINSSREHSIV